MKPLEHQISSKIKSRQKYVIIKSDSLEFVAMFCKMTLRVEIHALKLVRVLKF